MHSPPVLKVDETRLQYVDPQDPVELNRIWSVFSKASTLLEDGERLRNLSWRLYSRETLCCNRLRRTPRSNSDSSSTSSTFSGAHSATASEPDLSRSVDSIASSEDGTPAAIYSKSQPLERHITPADFQHLVYSIKHKQILKPSPPPCRTVLRSQTPQPVQPQPEPQSQDFSLPQANVESSTSTVATDSFASTVPLSDTSVSSGSASSQHSVVRGFTPGKEGITRYTSKTQLAPAPTPVPAPILKKSPTCPAPTNAKKSRMFTLGASSGEDEESFRDRMSPRAPRLTQRTSDGSKKQTSFKEEVLVMRSEKDQSPSEWESDSDSAAVESAIEDDDDDWEDDVSESKDDSSKELKFYRVDSKANLSSRRSALTLNIEEQRSGKHPTSTPAPTLRRSRTSTPSGPSIPASPTEDSGLTMAAKMQASKPIQTTSNMQTGPAVASPRTTRRHMLAGELSESLRMNMLSERKQKPTLDSTHIRRANTANDISKLGRVAEMSEPSKSGLEGTSIPMKTGVRTNWNDCFDHGVGEFHRAGW